MTDMRVVSMRKATESDIKESLDVLDGLRARVAAGEIVAMQIGALDADDELHGFTINPRGYSRMRFVGMLAWLTHMIINDD